MMQIFALSIIFLLSGHIFKVLRWSQSIEIYEKPYKSLLAKSLAISYFVNFCFPFRIGDLVRAILVGKKMKNGITLGIASVVVDRYLDIIAVGLIFLLLSLIQISSVELISTALFYISLSFVLVILSVVFFKKNLYLKKIIKYLCSIFNKQIELKLLYLAWSLISSFKDIYLKINRKKLVLNTLGMWCSYLLSYYLLALYISSLGTPLNFSDIFMLLFSKSSIDAATIVISTETSILLNEFPMMFSFYLILPLIILLILSFVVKSKPRVNLIRSYNYSNLMPHINPENQLAFLELYFTSDNRNYFSTYLNLNRDINIIEDFSAGSNATTMLCFDEKKSFYRKYAFGNDAEKLYEQIIWIQNHKNEIKLTDAYNIVKNENCCSYDMSFNSSATSFFNYIHSKPIEQSWHILKNVLNDLNNSLYKLNSRKSEEIFVKKYIEDKVTKNIEKIFEDKEYKQFVKFDKLIINGIEYKNINCFNEMLSEQFLQDLFEDDYYSDIHGDLTIENIICFDDTSDYYIIDPNTGNIHNSCFLDYAKLLQSLHGNYEFLMKIQNVVVEENCINFQFIKSVTYDKLLINFNNYLSENFTSKQIKSIYMHEIVHWLRLMPYKTKKIGRRSILFYAGFIIVLNEIERWIKFNEKQTSNI